MVVSPRPQAEITLQRSGSEDKEKLPAKGSIEVQAGDVLRIFSAGGGAFGAPEPEPAT
jgi:N-methylhydantoinase B/oxoprolinase/acetone carboxylase alpha subunit